VVIIDVPPGILLGSSEYGAVVLCTHANRFLAYATAPRLRSSGLALVQAVMLAGAFWMVRHSSGSM